MNEEIKRVSDDGKAEAVEAMPPLEATTAIDTANSSNKQGRPFLLPPDLLDEVAALVLPLKGSPGFETMALQVLTDQPGPGLGLGHVGCRMTNCSDDPSYARHGSLGTKD